MADAPAKSPPVVRVLVSLTVPEMEADELPDVTAMVQTLADAIGASYTITQVPPVQSPKAR